MSVRNEETSFLWIYQIADIDVFIKSSEIRFLNLLVGDSIRFAVIEDHIFI